MKKTETSQKGQALIMVIIFMLIASIVTSAAVAVVITNSAGSNKLQQGNIVYQIAESGIEDALLRLLRNPPSVRTQYDLSVGGDTATVIIEPTLTPYPKYSVKSTGYKNGVQRKIQAITDYKDNILSIISWKETTNE